MPFRWIRDPRTVLPQVFNDLKTSWDSRINRAVNELAMEIEAWMKQNAPWKDITGAARASLYAEVKHAAFASTTIMIGYGPDIDYAYWLETIQFGRYSIIGPAMDHFGERFFLKMQEAILANPRTGETLIR